MRILLIATLLFASFSASAAAPNWEIVALFQYDSVDECMAQMNDSAFTQVMNKYSSDSAQLFVQDMEKNEALIAINYVVRVGEEIVGLATLKADMQNEDNVTCSQETHLF